VVQIFFKFRSRRPDHDFGRRRSTNAFILDLVVSNTVSAVGMVGMSRFHVDIFIALFALGTAFHAVSATTMSIDMVLADSQNITGDGCQACPDDDKAAQLCDLVCTMTFVAVPVSFAIQPVAILSELNSVSDLDPPGRFRSPDPTPPRTFIHS
jgi:hypothetical protein